MEAERGEGGVLAQEHLQQQHRPAQHQRQQDVDWAQRGDLVFTNKHASDHTYTWLEFFIHFLHLEATTSA